MRIITLLICAMAAMSPVALGQAQLQESTFPAAGSHQTLLTVTKLDRYSLQVKGGFGVTLALADQMSGPLKQVGVLGSEDGRLDMLLDVGSYKINLTGPEHAKGNAQLEVTPFAAAKEPFPVLEELVVQEASMGDLEQRHFWVIVREPEVLRLEIMGRNLVDARLWLPGMWLTEHMPSVSRYEAVAGKPMTHLEFHHKLMPGQYLLTCYGGPDLAWAAEDGKHPLYLRSGYRQEGEFGRTKLTVSPFGREAILIPGSANYLEVRRAEKEQTTLTRQPFNENNSRYYDGYLETASINKSSRVPMASLETYDDQSSYWLVVAAAPGSQLEVQHFGLNPPVFIERAENLLVSHSSFAREDMFEPTGFAYIDNNNVLDTQFIQVGKNLPFARRISCENLVEAYVEILDEGEYVFDVLADSSADVMYRVRPLFTPHDYVVPPFRGTPTTTKLAKGRYMLDVSPQRAGILNFSFHPKDAPQGQVLNPEQVAQSLELHLDLSSYDYGPNVLMAGINSKKVGYDVRSIPWRYPDTFPFSVAPGVTFRSAFQGEGGLIFLEGDRGVLTLDDRPIESGALVSPGVHKFAVKNDSDRTAFYQINWRKQFAPFSTLALSSWNDIGKQPPSLSIKEPRFLDLEPKLARYFVLEVPEPGFYRVETSGRLSTTVSVRTRVDVNLFSNSENGIGRNGLIQQYLRAGSYLVSVLANNTSRGHVGVHLVHSQPQLGAPLLEGLVRKISLKADEAVRFPLHIDRDGMWRIQALGLDKSFQMRLEDRDGFPLFAVAQRSDFSLHLSEGDYTLYSLQEPLPSRRLFLLERLVPDLAMQGKGPFELVMNKTFAHEWRQGEPDIFQLKLPANAPLTINLTQGMRADLSLNGTSVGRVDGGQVWTHKLSAGDLTLAVRRTETDDRFPYSLIVETATLMDGIPLELPADRKLLSVSLAEAGLVDLQSFGAHDVNAQLLDASGQILLASSEDSTDDWNFKITRNLEPGEYQLKIGERGKGSGNIHYALNLRQPRQVEAASLPFVKQLQPDADVLEIPLESASQGALDLKLRSIEATRFAILDGEKLVGEGGAEGRLILPAGASYRMLIWFSEAKKGELELKTTLPKVNQVNLDQGSSSLKGEGPWHLLDPMGRVWWAKSKTPVYVCRGEGQMAQVVGDGLVNLDGGEGWLFGRDVQLTPVQLGADLFALPLDAIPMTLTVSNPSQDPALAFLRGASAQPAAQIKALDQPSGPFDWTTMSETAEVTVVGVPPGRHVLRIWAYDPKNPPGNVNLSQIAYVLGETRDFEPHQGSLAAHASLRLNLSGSEAGLELLLGKGLVAMLSKDNRAYATAAALDGNRAFALAAQGGALTLINTSGEAQIYEVKSATAAQVTTLSASGAEWIFDKPGLLRLRTETLSRKLRVRGENLSLRWKADNGAYVQAENQALLPGDAALLELNHGEGLVMLDYISDSDAGTETALALNPGETLVKASSTWSFTLSEPGLVCLSASSALLSFPEIAGSERYGSGEVRIHGYFEAGSHQLYCRPLAKSGETSLSFSVQTLAPMLADTPMRLLREGDTHAWSFKVSELGKVGVGLATDADRLDATLYDINNKVLSHSTFLISALEPGSYIFVVEGHGDPVRYRPLLYGADGPGSVIPEEVMRSFQSTVESAYTPANVADPSASDDASYDESSDETEENQE